MLILKNLKTNKKNYGIGFVELMVLVLKGTFLETAGSVI